MKPRKHAEIIKAWAEGAKIEYRVKDGLKGWGEWKEDDSPRFLTDPWWEFRIKPTTAIKWNGLNEAIIHELWKASPLLIGFYSYSDVAKEIESFLKEKNNHD